MDSAGGLVRRRASVPDDLALPDDRAEAHRVAAPALGELGDNPEDKQLLNLYASGGAIGRAFIIPPGTQPAALKALQDGFLAMTRDPEFLAEMQKGHTKTMFGKGAGSEIYQDMFNDTLSRSVSKSGSFGIGKVLYKQFAKGVLRQEAAHLKLAAREAAPSDPIDLKG